MNMKKPGHTWIPNYWIVGDEISDPAFRTLAVIRSYNFDQIYPSVDRIAERRGKCRSVIFIHLRELKKKKYITTRRSGYSTSNIYKFISPENRTIEPSPTSSNETPIVQETDRQPSNNSDPNKGLNNGLKSGKDILKGRSLEQTIDEIRNRFEFLQKDKKPP